MSNGNNGTTLKRIATIVSITIGSLILLGAIGGIFVDRYINKETCERSIKNETKNIEQDKKLNEHETAIQVQKTQYENIEKSLDKIDKKLDRALRR